MKSYTIYIRSFDGIGYRGILCHHIKCYLAHHGYKTIYQRRKSFYLDGIMDGSGGAIIQNNDTQQFFIIDFHDKNSVYSDDIRKDKFFIEESIIQHSLCVGVLKLQYRHGENRICEKKISPYTYFLYEPMTYDRELGCIKATDTVKIKNKLSFIGTPHFNRYFILKQLIMYGIINNNCLDSPTMSDSDKLARISMVRRYLIEMKLNKIALSLPGKGYVCHREIEAFGANIPVLMPNLKNSFYNQLVPNNHYVSVDIDVETAHFQDIKIKNFYSEKLKSIYHAEKIIDRFNEVINDDDYLRYVSDNAYQWYQNNVEYPNNIRLMEEILLNKFNYKLLY